MMTIKHQLSSFGFEYDEFKRDSENVIDFLNTINHRKESPTIVHGVKNATIENVSLRLINPKETKLLHSHPQPIPEDGIAGILLYWKGKDYIILDVYHRFSWLLQSGKTEAAYIILS